MRSSLVTTREQVDGSSEPSVPAGYTRPPVDLRGRRVRTSAGTEPVVVARARLGAEVSRLAGRPGTAHQQGRLLHLVVGEGRRGQGHHDDGHQGGDADASHRLARCSIDAHDAVRPCRSTKRTRPQPTRFGSARRGWAIPLTVIRRGRCRRALGCLGLISLEQPFAALVADLPALASHDAAVASPRP